MGHTGEDTLEKALVEAGYFDEELKQITQYRSLLSQAYSLAHERELDSLGEYVYLSPFRPIAVGGYEYLKNIQYINIGTVGVIFNPVPYNLDTLVAKDLIPINNKSFLDYCRQKSQMLMS